MMYGYLRGFLDFLFDLNLTEPQDQYQPKLDAIYLLQLKFGPSSWNFFCKNNWNILKYRNIWHIRYGLSIVWKLSFKGV